MSGSAAGTDPGAEDPERADVMLDPSAVAAPEDRDFRRGNINFDFLPETHHRPRAVPEGDRREGRRRGKRGLFNRGRPARPVGRMLQTFWAAGAVVSICLVMGLSLWDGPALRILFLPVPLFAGMWCLMMLLLFRARPS